MATGMDTIAGYSLTLLATLIFTYYTIWVIALPFVDSGHIIHSYFLPRLYAVTIPVVAGVALLSLIGLYLVVILIKSRKPKQKTS